MRLAELEPRFVHLEFRTETYTRILGDPHTWKRGDPTEQVTGPREYHIFVDEPTRADGIFFLCPKCYTKNHGKVGTHRIMCWFMGRVPDETWPRPGRWTLIGDNFDDLSLGPGPNGKASVLLTDGCGAHFNVVLGGIIDA